MIDDQVKRASVLGIVQPDAGIDQSDRQTLLGVYGGILAGAFVEIIDTITESVIIFQSSALFVSFMQSVDEDVVIERSVYKPVILIGG